MAKTQDFNSAMKDIMGAFPVDTKAMDDAFKNQAALSEKLSGVALSAAEKSAEISSKWTKETLAKLNDITKAKAEPADYAKAFTDFASANAEVASENMAAFAEIAKKVQMEPKPSRRQRKTSPQRPRKPPQRPSNSRLHTQTPP